MRIWSLVLFVPVFALLSSGFINCICDNQNIEIDTNEQSLYENNPIDNDIIHFSNIENCFTENLGQKGEGAGFYYVLGDPLSASFGRGFVSYYMKSFNGNKGALIKLNFPGSNDVIPIGYSELECKYNFFLGNDPDNWHTNVKNYREVWYRDLYDGIDLKYYFDNGKMKYEFHIDEWIDPSIIKIQYEGVTSLKINDAGNLEINNGLETIIDEKPISIQNINNNIIFIESDFLILDETTLYFSIDVYDEAYPIIIDPIIEFSTFVGGTNPDSCYDIVVDKDGNIVFIGVTQSTDFPVSTGAYDTSFNGQQDFFIGKLNPSGSLLLSSTFLGGNDVETGSSITLDNNGDIIIFGYSRSSDFPVTSNAYDPTHNGNNDFVICKLNSSASDLKYSTFIGGSGRDTSKGLSIASNGEIIILGASGSTDFPVTSGAFDTSLGGGADYVVTRINISNNNLIFSTYIGGDIMDTPQALELDSNENVVVVGNTYSSNFPITAGAYDTTLNGMVDGVILKLSSNGSNLVFSTLIGGRYEDYCNGLHLNEFDEIYVCGMTYSSDFPTTSGAYDTSFNGGEKDGFVLCLSSSGSALDYSTLIGGDGKESIMDVICMTNGDIIVIGQTTSSNYPTSQDSFNSTLFGGQDITISHFDENLSSLKFSTYFGGNLTEYGWKIVKDTSQNLIIAGSTSSGDFPVTQGVFDSFLNGTTDGFILSLRLAVGFPPRSIDSLRIFSDSACQNEINWSEMNRKNFIQIFGEDGNSSSVDDTKVIIKNVDLPSNQIIITLTETGKNTGEYLGNFTVSGITDPLHRRIKGNIGDNIDITSIQDNSKNALIMIKTQVYIISDEEIYLTLEDQEFVCGFWNIGYNPATNWNFWADCSWLEWDPEKHEVRGIPDNGNVGDFIIRLNITDGIGHYDERSFLITVINVPPRILTDIEEVALEDEKYSIDFDCDDEGQGDTEWSISPSYIDWLNLDPTTGVLSGTPLNDDVGAYDLNISVDDGNGGLNWTEFTLTVLDKNDPPIITTEPPTETLQGESYYLQFSAIDEDDINTYEWTLKTDARFLEFNNQTGVLSGTPENDDVGIYFVNISAEDLRGETDSLNFSLEVIDVNDDPEWVNIPLDSDVDQGEIFLFQVEASDVDHEDDVTYRSESSPDVGIEIDSVTGLIEWNATNEGITPNPDYIVQVTIYASDGEVEISHWFSLKVIPNPTPISKLMSPDDDELVPSLGLFMRWEGEDDSTDLKYDIYLSESYNSILEFRPEALRHSDLSETRIWISGLTSGSTYYWTVIPKDQYSIGTCQEDIYSFRVNRLPEINNISSQATTVGEEFSYSISGSDSETSNDDLVYSLISAPDGMEIFEDRIFWTPVVGDLGSHVIEISLFDGLEYTNTSFEITVTSGEIEPEDDEGGFPIWVIILILLIMILLIGAGIGAYIFMKKTGESEPTQDIMDAPPEDTKPAPNDNVADPIQDTPLEP